MDKSIYTRPDKPKTMLVSRRKESPERVALAVPDLLMVDRSTECFVTPASVIDLMIEHAGLLMAHKILEPSAGTGAIAIRVRELHPCADLHVFELSPTLQHILKELGFDPCGSDFLEFNGSGQYDRILMNPPFSKLQDIDHVRKAYECLAPDGRLIAIMGAGAFFNCRNKAKDFRDWLDQLDSEYFDLPKDSFKDSGTLANSKLVIIDK